MVQKLILTETTKYPFEDQVNFTVNAAKSVNFHCICAYLNGAKVHLLK
jgi:DUF1680 family protein